MARFISDSFKQRLRSEANLPEIASEYTNLKKVGANYMGLCPNPNHKDSNPSFIISPPNDKNNFYSWRCFSCHQGSINDGNNVKIENRNYGTDPIAFMRWVNSWTIKDDSFYTALISLANKCGLPLPDSKEDELYQKKYRECIAYMQNLKSTFEGRQYLYNRGMDDNDIETWKLGLIGPSKIAEIAGTNLRALNTKYV